MNQNSFQYEEKYRWYKAEEHGFQIVIPEAQFTPQSRQMVATIVDVYPKKLADIAAFCLACDAFVNFFPNETEQSIQQKLHLPIIKLDAVGGRLTYTQHELDEDHLIDIEFEGALETLFSVEIDG